MPRWTIPSRTVTHLSPVEQKGKFQVRLAALSLWLMVFLWGGGTLTLIVLHILQASDPQRFTSPDWSTFLPILLIPPLIALFFCFTSLAIASLGRDAKLDLLGREVIVKPVTMGLRKIDENVEDVCTVEFETPDEVHHRVELVVPPGVSPYASSVRIRYDPLNLSNVVFIPEPRPSRHPIRALFRYCGCLLGSLILLGCTLFFLALLLFNVFVPASPHP